jgi:hypothetical protein
MYLEKNALSAATTAIEAWVFASEEGLEFCYGSPLLR